jgi:hypothetical protein
MVFSPLFDLLANGSFLFLGDLDFLAISECQVEDVHIALSIDKVYHRPARVWHPMVGTVLQLLVIHDSTSHWNMRKQWILSNELDPSFDLRFTSLLLSKHPKRLETSFFTVEFFDMEMNLCEMAAERHKANYHAWNYRRQVLLLFEGMVIMVMH